jgi:primosomal protein N'
LSCGRTAFSVPRGGVSQLISQLEKSTKKPIVEITAESDNTWTQGSVFVGTEAALFRVPHADTVVFADIDRDLSAPRVTAPREVAALLIRAARLVGSRGTIVVQTRTPNHPLLMAFVDSNVTQGLMEWSAKDIEQRRVFSLPPFAELVSLSLAEDESFADMPTLNGVDTALMSGQLILKSISRDSLREAIDVLRGHYGARLRVHADPTRY